MNIQQKRWKKECKRRKLKRFKDSHGPTEYAAHRLAQMKDKAKRRVIRWEKSRELHAERTPAE